MRKGQRERFTRWSIGERVATPTGLVAEIVSLNEERALIRYLGPHQGSEEIELELSLLRPATERDLYLAGIR
jgi:hypothetical protein